MSISTIHHPVTADRVPWHRFGQGSQRVFRQIRRSNGSASESVGMEQAPSSGNPVTTTASVRPPRATVAEAMGLFNKEASHHNMECV